MNVFLLKLLTALDVVAIYEYTMPNANHLHSNESSSLGPLAKKPKLSIEVSSSLSAKTTANDDLWGDDLPEDDLEECFQLATQICTQIKHEESRNHRDTNGLRGIKEDLIANVTSHTSYHGQGRPSNLQFSKNLSSVKVSQQTVPSTIFNVFDSDAAFVPNEKSRPKESTNANRCSLHGSSNHLSKSSYSGNNNISVKNTTASHALLSQQKEAKNEWLDQLKNENESLKERSLTKDGEILMLRQELKKCDIKASNHLHSTVEEFKRKICLLERELDKAKTAAELQKLETWKATDKLLMVNNTQVAPDTSTVSSGFSDEFDGACSANPLNSDGELLLEAISPYLFEKSHGEHCTVKLESMFSLEDDSQDKTVPTIYPDPYTIKSCWDATVQLSLERSFSTCTAHSHIKKIFFESLKILCSLLSRLRVNDEKETKYNFNSQCDSSKMDAVDNHNLLSHKACYENEKGIESRCVLALVGKISLFSECMADLVTGINQKIDKSFASLETEVNYSQDLTQAVADKSPVGTLGDDEPTQPKSYQSQVKKFKSSHKIFDELQPSYHILGQENCQKLNFALCKISDSHVRVSKQNSKEYREYSNILELFTHYKNKQFGFLNLLLDISEEIADQNISQEYSGYLTAVITLLTNCQRKGIPILENDEQRDIIATIVKVIIFSQPRVETSAAIIELLSKYSLNVEFLDTLCHCSQTKSNWEIKNRIGQFEENCCALRVLCWQLERPTTSVSLRTQVCRSMINLMMVLVKSRPFGGPRWTRLLEPNQVDKCFCRTRMVEVSITRLYETFQDFEKLAHMPQMEMLRDTVVKGIMLLFYQLDSDPGFVFHMEEVEGYYQLLLMSLKNTNHDLRFQEHERNTLRDLLAMEESITPQRFELTDNLVQYFQNFFDKIRNYCVRA